MYDQDTASVKTPEKTPEVFVLTERIKEEIGYIRRMLQPIIQETPKTAEKESVSTPLLNELKIILRNLHELKSDIQL